MNVITHTPPAANATAPLQDLNDVKATANYLHCGKTHIFSLLRTGQLASVKVGRKRLIPATAIRNYVERLMS